MENTPEPPLEETVARQAQELALLHDAGRLLGLTLDQAVIYDALQTLVARVMDCDGLLVSLYAPGDNLIRCSYAWVEGRRLDVTAFPALELAPQGQGLQSQVIRTGEPVLINDFPAHARRHRALYYASADGSVRDAPAEESTRSLLMVPWTLEGHVLGAVQVQSHRLDAYTPEHLRLLESLTGLVAAASRNAYLYRQAQEELSERRRVEAENVRLLQESREAAAQQRMFLRDVLASVTEGKLRLCDTPDQLPERLSPVGDAVILDSTAKLAVLRQQTREAAQALGFTDLRWQHLITSVGEAAMNAIVHAGGGFGQVCTDGRERVQVWVTDTGLGIAVQILPQATLERGWTTAGSLGHGFWLILQTIDRVYLLTGPTGTVVVLEQDRDPILADWI